MDTRKSRSILMNECGVSVYEKDGWLYLENAAFTYECKDTQQHRAQMMAEAMNLIHEIKSRYYTNNISDAPFEIKLCIEKYYAK